MQYLSKADKVCSIYLMIEVAERGITISTTDGAYFQLHSKVPAIYYCSLWLKNRIKRICYYKYKMQNNNIKLLTTDQCVSIQR